MEPAGGASDDSPVNPTGDSGAAGSGETDPFQVLRPITAFGCIRLNVPALWSDYRDKRNGMWCCCEELEDSDAYTGTLWIDFKLLEPTYAPFEPDEAAAGALDYAQGVAARIVREIPSKQNRFVVVDSARTPDGSISRMTRRAEEKGELLVFHRWDRAVAIGHHVMVLHFSLVFTERTAERPAWKQLAETLDREVRAAVICLPEDG